MNQATPKLAKNFNNARLGRIENYYEILDFTQNASQCMWQGSLQAQKSFIIV